MNKEDAANAVAEALMAHAGWDNVVVDGDVIAVYVDDWTWKMVVATEPEVIA